MKVWLNQISSLPHSGERKCGEYRCNRGRGHLPLSLPVLPVRSQQHRQPVHTPGWHHCGRGHRTSRRSVWIWQKGRRMYVRIRGWFFLLQRCHRCRLNVFNSRHLYVSTALLDMTINQFLKSLGLEHLRDIFQREQVLTLFSVCLEEEKSDESKICEELERERGGRSWKEIQSASEIFVRSYFLILTSNFAIVLLVLRFKSLGVTVLLFVFVLFYISGFFFALLAAWLQGC